MKLQLKPTIWLHNNHAHSCASAIQYDQVVVVFRHRINIPVVLLHHTLGHRPHSSKPNIVEATAPQVVIAFGMITTTTVSGAVSTRATLRCQKLLPPRSFFTSHQAHYRHRQAGSSSTIRRPKSLPSHGVRHLPQNRTPSSSLLKPLYQAHIVNSDCLQDEFQSNCIAKHHHRPSGWQQSVVGSHCLRDDSAHSLDEVIPSRATVCWPTLRDLASMRHVHQRLRQSGYPSTTHHSKDEPFYHLQPSKKRRIKIISESCRRNSTNSRSLKVGGRSSSNVIIYQPSINNQSSTIYHHSRPKRFPTIASRWAV